MKIKDSLAILIRIPWKITKLQSQHSMTGRYRPASETPFKWLSLGADDGPLIVVSGSFHPSSTKKKNGVKVGPPLTKLSGSARDPMLYSYWDDVA